MKNRTLLGGFVAAAVLVTGACSSTGTANKTTNTTTNTSTATVTNTANRATPPASNSANAAAPTAPASSAPAEGKQDFTVHNATGVEIDKLYVSAHSTDDWEEDILGQDTLPNGESVSITFSPKEKAALWDLKIVDKAGTSIEWENLNLMEISDLTLHFNNGKATAEAK